MSHLINVGLPIFTSVVSTALEPASKLCLERRGQEKVGTAEMAEMYFSLASNGIANALCRKSMEQSDNNF